MLKVRIAREDIISLRVINQESWNILSDRTGRISNAVGNFLKWSENSQLIPPIPDTTVRKWVSELMGSLPKYRSRAGKSNLNRRLILVGASEEGQFTIIEGNKTSLGLYLRYVIDHPELKYPTDHLVYIGTSPAMDHYQWHNP